MVHLGSTQGPQTEGSGALQQMPGRLTSPGSPSAHLSAQQASAGPALGAVLPRVTSHPLGLGHPQGSGSHRVWEIR